MDSYSLVQFLATLLVILHYSDNSGDKKVVTRQPGKGFGRLFGQFWSLRGGSEEVFRAVLFVTVWSSFSPLY